VASLLDDLLALTLGDNRELAFICADVLAEFGVEEPGVETYEYNCVSVTIDRNESTVTFRGVLPINDKAITISADRFMQEASSVAEARSLAEVSKWMERRQGRIWPMPPAHGTD
jgi:hypothetical protein